MIEINMNLVYTIINVIILYLLLRHFLIKPVTDIMEKRKQLIADGLQSAQDAQDGALKMKQEYEAALNGAKQESVQIVENARKSAKAEYDRILEEAGNKADSMITSAISISSGSPCNSACTEPSYSLRTQPVTPKCPARCDMR